jgi:hypothetical protein
MGASIYFTAALIRYLAGVKARIIAAVKNMDEPMLLRV